MTEALEASLTPGARQLMDAAQGHQSQHKHDVLGTHHWLLALLQRHGPMAETMVEDIDARALIENLITRLNDGDTGEALDEQTVVQRGSEKAIERGKKQTSERDLAVVILAAASYTPVEEESEWTAPAGTPVASQESGPARPRGGKLTPMLDKFGRDLTREAREGKLPPIVGRDREIELACRVLLRRTKRNPVLIGPAGVGKTAIVEGLAQRVVADNVPAPLQGIRIVELQPSNLVAGADMMGELQERMEKILSEASHSGIVLFIDEIHTIVGAGGMAGTGDIGQLLKPALARGQIACIGATTDDEYRRFIEPDKALERRFNPIAVHEMLPEDTLIVVRAHRDKLAELKSVKVPDDVLHWFVDFCREFLRNRTFPDKAVDLLEQSVAYALVHGKAEVAMDDARTVAQELVGMPIDLDVRLDALEKRLSEEGPLLPDDVEVLMDRLNVTLRGLDIRASRPNAVVLLLDQVADAGEVVAEAIAESLYGDVNRVVEIDFDLFDNAEDANSLLGPPPGYIGFGDRLPLHEVVTMSWSVVLCKNMHGCHPEVRSIWTQALADGVVTERSGKRIFLSDTVVLMTAAVGVSVQRQMGFQIAEADTSSDVMGAAEAELGASFVHEADLVCAEVRDVTGRQESWIEKVLLPELGNQYRSQGLRLTWDESVVAWVQVRQQSISSRVRLARQIETDLGEVLIPLIPAAGSVVDVQLAVKDEALTAEPGDAPRKGATS